MVRIVLVHGIHDNVKNWRDFSKELESKGYEVVRFAYPSRWSISYYLPWIQRNDGLRLAQTIKDGDHVIAHSNGGNLVQSAIKNTWKDGKIGVVLGKVFMLSVAATSDKMHYPSGCLNKCYVVYNPKDKALMLGAKLPFHPFGSMGLLGFVKNHGVGKDNRFENIPNFWHEEGDDLTDLNHNPYNTTERSYWISEIHKLINKK